MGGACSHSCSEEDRCQQALLGAHGVRRVDDVKFEDALAVVLRRGYQVPLAHHTCPRGLFLLPLLAPLLVLPFSSFVRLVDPFTVQNKSDN